MASTMPSNVSVLIENSIAAMTMNVEMMATGIVRAGMIVARSEPRNAKITISTSISEKARAFSTSFIDSRIDSEKSTLTRIRTSDGNSDCIRSTSTITASFVSRIFAFACGTIPRLTPATPSLRATSRALSGSSRISATSASRM